MDKSEALLFQHISIVIKLLNCFTHKHNITSSDVLHRLDYLYERLSDFLGRELNEWWLNSDQEKSQFSQHFIPLLKPGSPKLQLSEYVQTTKPSISLTLNSETSQNDETKNTITEVTHPLASSSKEEGDANPEVQKIDVSDMDYANGKFPNYVEPTEHVTELNHSSQMSSKTTEILSPLLHCSDDKSTLFECKSEDCNKEISSFNTDKKILMSQHIESAEHQKALKQEVKTPSVSIKAKRNVTEKPRNDLGRYVIERVTTTYFCDVCNVNNVDDVKDHVFNIKHQTNMREMKGIEVAGTENTESICMKSMSCFRCTLCSVDTSGIKNMEDHKLGQRHVKKLLEQVSDPNISLTANELYKCVLCSVNLSNLHIVNEHLKGKHHQNKLEHKTSLVNICKKQKRETAVAHYTNYSDIAMVCKVCNVYVLKVHLTDHLTSKSHLNVLKTCKAA